ncbi:hypothetical protein [Vibrio phage LV6]|nr:hypothetical protein [Vibrio phage LV6]
MANFGHPNYMRKPPYSIELMVKSRISYQTLKRGLEQGVTSPLNSTAIVGTLEVGKSYPILVEALRSVAVCRLVSIKEYGHLVGYKIPESYKGVTVENRLYVLDNGMSFRLRVNSFYCALRRVDTGALMLIPYSEATKYVLI